MAHAHQEQALRALQGRRLHHPRPVLLSKVCAGFPWLDAETGGRYEYDISICGEFDLTPELVAIHRAIPAAGSATVAE
jgi:hypothetical protein